MADLQIQPPFLWSAGFLWPVACTTVVIARFAIRKTQKHGQLGWDDWLTVPALFLIWGLCVGMLIGVGTRSMGYPTPVTSPELSLVATSREQTITRKIFWAYLLIQTPSLTFIKLSCLAFYRRVFVVPGHNKRTDIIIWILIIIMLIWGISFTVSCLMLCGTLENPEWLWTNIENQSKCSTDTVMSQEALGISDVITDAIILIFPVPHIWRLHMDVYRKIGLTFIFLLGASAVAMSATRLVILLGTTGVEFQERVDQNFLSTDAMYFMLLEAGFGLCAISLPALSGALGFKGVQTFFQNVSAVFSIRSKRSTSLNETRRMASISQSHLSKVESKQSVAREPRYWVGGHCPKYLAGIEPVPAMYHPSHNGQVNVTRTVELKDEPV